MMNTLLNVCIYNDGKLIATPSLEHENLSFFKSLIDKYSISQISKAYKVTKKTVINFIEKNNLNENNLLTKKWSDMNDYI